MTIFWMNTAIILCTIPSLIQGHGYLIDRDLIEKKDGFKFNFHSGSGIVRDKGFRSLGCWKDTWIRAIEVLEKKHELLMDKNYKLREDPLRKCAIAALDKKMKLFAIENGGQCLGDVSITSSYKKYGEAHHCKEDGYGGPWSMQVYGFTGSRRRDGGYSKWSRWTECSAACGKGTRKRFRTCTHPSPTLGGRDCSRLGLGMESKACETECLGTENDEMEDPGKMRNSVAKQNPHKSSANKKSDDTDDYLDYDDDDDDVDDPDNDEDNHDKTTDNSEDKPDKTSNGKNGNKLDENDFDTRPSHESTDLAHEGKNTNARLLKPAVKMFEDQGKTIDGNQNTKVLLSSPSTTDENMDETKSLSQGTLDIQPGSNNKNNEPGNGGSKDDESRQDNRLSPLPQTTATGDAMKKPVAGLSQGTTDVQLGSTNESNDHSNGVSDGDKSGQENGVSPSPQTSGTSSGVGGKIKQFSSSENRDEKTQQNVNNDTDDDAMENHLSDISSTQASDRNADVKEPGNTADIESDDPEVNTVQSTSDARVSDKEISGNVPSEKESSQDNNKDIASNEKDEDVDENTNDTPLSGGKSTTEDEVLNNETSNKAPNVKEPSQSSDNTDTGDIGENHDDNASNSQSNDDKSIMENKALNSVNSNDAASMKGQSHGSATFTTDETFPAKNNLPYKQQVKAAQDLLRSRWLSLAKSGRLKSTPTAHSDIKTFKSSKPVVDVSLKDDSMEDFEDQEMEDDDDGEVDNEKVTGKKIDDEEVNGQVTNGWKEEEQDKKQTQMDDKIDDKTTEGHTQKEQNENIQKNDNDSKATYGGQMEGYEDTTDEQKTNEDSAGDHTMSSSEMDQHEEPLSEHKENEMDEVEGQANGIVMNDKISQEGGAKRVKEECICPKLDLMGKPGPNVKPCPCMLQPSKKTDAEKIDKANTQMSEEEYKSGMFHASGLPKADTSSETSPQPLFVSKNPGATLTTTTSTSPPKKPITVMSKTKPSVGNSPAHAIMPVKTGGSQPAPLSAPEKTSTASQNIMASSLPATQFKPAITPVTVGATQATPIKASEKVIHIKHDKLKPLSKTLSALGESLNQAHDKGELEEGKYALDSDIHNLLKTIGKLKSQVDNLRNDQAQLGNNDVLGSSQLGTVSEAPSKSQDTGKSNNQSSPSILSTSQSTLSSGNTYQSQSSLGNESSASKGLDSKSEFNGQIPLKLRIVDKIANKQQKNATTLHLELSDKIKQAQSVGKPLFQSPSLGITKGNSSVSQDTPAPLTTSVPSTDNMRTGANSVNSTVFAANKAAPEPKRPLQTKVAQQTTLPSKVVKVTQTPSLKQPQSNAASQQPQQDIGKTGVNGDAQNTIPSNVVAGNMLKTSQLSVKPQSLTQTQTTTTDAKQTTNALSNAKPNPPLATSSKIVKAPPSELATNAVTTATLQDTKPKKPNPQTNTLPQQTVIQKVKPIASKPTTNVKPPQSNTQLPTQSKVAPQQPIPSNTSPQSVVTNDQAIQPQSNAITQQSLHENTIQNAAGQLASTNPSTTAGNQRQTATQKTKDFAAIESQLAKIVETQQATEKSTIPDCNINLGFVLDGSASVEGTRRGNFLKMINFVKDMIHEFVVLSQQVHVGTLVYSTNSSVILSFGTKGTEKVIDQILDSIHYPGQGSLTGKAIKDSWNQMFSAVPRGRKSKLVLLTDGPSNDDVKVPAKWIRDNGVEMFVIGLGKGYDETQLRDMASLPSDKHIMYKDYDGLGASVQEVRNKVCRFSPREVLQIMTSARMSDNLKESTPFNEVLAPTNVFSTLSFCSMAQDK